MQVIEVAEALLLLYTEDMGVWQKKKCKGSDENKDTSIDTSSLTTTIKTGSEEEIWVRKLHKTLYFNWHQNKIMRTEASSDYTYPLTPSDLKWYHRCDQAKNMNVMEEEKKTFL